MAAFQNKHGKEVNLSREQQSNFINLIYDNKEVFSLYDEDLSYCDQLKHMIPTMMDRPVYLPHYMISWQLQGMQMIRYLVVPWNYMTIQKPTCITGGNRAWGI